MKRAFLLCAAGLGFLLPGQSLLYSASPVELDPAVALDVYSGQGAASDIRFLGQVAKDGVIDLTASNGFFDRCFEAQEAGPGIEADRQFIVPTFGYLKGRRGDARGTARWHLWVAKAGEVEANFYLTVPKGAAGHEWTMRLGEQTRILKANAGDGDSPQKQVLTFEVAKPGRLVFTIDCSRGAPQLDTRVHFIRLRGAAIDEATLLRTRWRPAAVHARFYAPADCPEPKMWVFETRAVSKATSYSPLTTGFGYYGTSFKQGGRIQAGAGFNFSMWAAGRDADVAPPLPQMPRLIGTGIPGAQFSTFGHEGTGVKFRNAVAYPDGAERTIQALRIEPAEGGVLTYYGYFYDEKSARWRLYASGQKPPKKSKAAGGPGFGTLTSTGSFCEIPGPPNRERSGDVVREIKRRGWFHGSDGKWYRAVLAHALPDQAGRRKKGKTAPAVTNKSVHYMTDYATEGWMAMSTGGVTYRAGNQRSVKPPEPATMPPLPGYLAADKTKQLFTLPVMFGPSEATAVGKNRASIAYQLEKTGPNSKAILYYGTVDCITYPAKAVSKGSAVQIDMARAERTWQFATPELTVKAGENLFLLKNLQAGKDYFYRLYVEHDEGRSWDYRSGRFTTRAD